MEIGGAETSLIGLLQALDPKRVDVYLFINDHRGEMMRCIPEWVKILPPIPLYTMIERPMKEVLKKGYYRLFLARLLAKWKFYLYNKKYHPAERFAILGYLGRYVTSILPPIGASKIYDLAISFVTPHDIVLNKVKAKKKICWIHTDYTTVNIDADWEFPVWNGYDSIVSISADVTRTFCEVFPSLRNKIVEMENIISPEFVRQRANLGSHPLDMPAEKDTTILLTIGRYTYQKKWKKSRLFVDCFLKRDVK